MNIDSQKELQEPISKKVSDEQPLKSSDIQKKDKVTMKNWLIELYWGHGNAYEHFNTVCSTSHITNNQGRNFVMMQALRVLSLILMITISVCYFYIFVRSSPVFYNFSALVTTTLAFFFLFVDSGKQKCYQQRVDPTDENHVYDFHDEKAKHTRWMLGVFLYSIGLPMTLVSNFIYFVPFNAAWGGQSHDDYYRTVREDINMNIAISHDYRLNRNGFRKMIVLLSHVLPMACYFLDFLLNKIRFPIQSLIPGLLHMIIWLVITYIGQRSKEGYPIYYQNLNWLCDENFSVLSNKTNQKTWKRSNKLCAQRTKEPKFKDYDCTDLFQNYYCETEYCKSNQADCAKVWGKDDLTRVPYSAWSQNWSMVVTMTVIYIILFLILYFVHNLWSKNCEGYKGPQEKESKVAALNESEKTSKKIE